MHKTVREETPVLAEQPVILKETKEYLVVNKPSSMPVHSCGNFRHNTLMSILEHDFGYVADKKGEIKTVHRLDR